MRSAILASLRRRRNNPESGSSSESLDSDRIQKYAMLRPQAATAIQMVIEARPAFLAAAGMAAPAGRLSTARRAHNSYIATLMRPAPTRTNFNRNTRLTLHILAAVAEHEREMIAERTKAALQAAKARGVRLGRNGADRLAPAYRAQALERAWQLFSILTELKRAGMSARQMAAELTARGILTPTGARWHAQTVLRMLGRAGSVA